MADSCGASSSPNLTPLVHKPRKKRERKKTKCILATCAIRNDILKHDDCLVGTGFLVKGLFKCCDRKIHLITSDNVISSDDLSCYFLCFKGFNGRNKKWRKLLSICDQEIFNSHGLAIVLVNPNKFNAAHRLTSGLLNHRPFTICTKKRKI